MNIRDYFWKLYFTFRVKATAVKMEIELHDEYYTNRAAFIAKCEARKIDIQTREGKAVLAEWLKEMA